MVYHKMINFPDSTDNQLLRFKKSWLKTILNAAGDATQIVKLNSRFRFLGQAFETTVR